MDREGEGGEGTLPVLYEYFPPGAPSILHSLCTSCLSHSISSSPRFHCCLTYVGRPPSLRPQVEKMYEARTAPALSGGPAPAQLLCDEGAALYAQCRADEAERSYVRALRADPDQAASLCGLAWLLRNEKADAFTARVGPTLPMIASQSQPAGSAGSAGSQAADSLPRSHLSRFFSTFRAPSPPLLCQ